jgi:competence protein ComEA
VRDRLQQSLGAFIARVGISRVLGTSIGVVVTALGVWWVVRVPPPPVETTIPLATTVSIAVQAVGSAPAVLVVHVAGEVVAPGVYELPAGARMVDAIDAAGGPSSRADTDAINLATPLADAQQVFVPRKGAPVRRVTESGASADDAAQDGTINVNTASASALESLPGVGPQTAQAIIEHRTKNGPFLAVDELLNVRGIGPAKLAAMRAKVRV